MFIPVERNCYTEAAAAAAAQPGLLLLLSALRRVTCFASPTHRPLRCWTRRISNERESEARDSLAIHLARIREGGEIQKKKFKLISMMEEILSRFFFFLFYFLANGSREAEPMSPAS